MKNSNDNTFQVFTLVFLRVLIGWHLLYEGMVKLLDSGWTSKEFLLNAQGPLSDFFLHLASNNSLLLAVDFLNIWGLVLVGLSLMLGFLTRIGLISGIILLFLYYIANPPFLTISPLVKTEGSYLIVNKNLIELAAMLVLLAFKKHFTIGLDRFFIRP